jgi:hypothetical protein
MDLLSTHKLFCPWRYIADSKYQIPLQLKAISLFTFLTTIAENVFSHIYNIRRFTECPCRTDGEYSGILKRRYVDPNGRREVTAELQTSAYSFFASIQNWLNDFSLKLR